MTYQELLALINPANAVTRTDGVSAMGDTPGYSTTTPVDGWYYADPTNPLGGAVQDLGDELNQLSAAEEFFNHLDVAYDPGVLHVNRLHILPILRALPVQCGHPPHPVLL